jgi:type 1 glutamine amidotransferase
MKNRYISIILTVMLVALMAACTSTDKIKTLIVTGQGEDNLVWMTRSQAAQQILDDAGLFSTKILVSPPEGEDMSKFNPDFSKYDLVVIDYEGDAWPKKTIGALQNFVNNGGGVVRLQSRSEPGTTVPATVTVSERHDFEVRTRISDHPVTAGLPVRWLHPRDVIVQGMPLVGESFQVLATAFSDKSFAGSGQAEPVLVAKNVGQGRVFMTMLGTPDLGENQALKCAGFIVTLQRGAEWAATGTVTQTVPFDFPTAAGAVLRPDYTGVKFDEAFAKIGSYQIGSSTLYFTWLQNQIRKASGDKEALLNLEKKMVEVLNNAASTSDAKKLILNELSWMGTDYCVPAVKELALVPELKDAVDFALTRLQ